MINRITQGMITHEQSLNGNELDVTLSFPTDSPIFAGHFAQMPILAGAYQLLLCQHWAERLLNKRLRLKSISKTRLSGLILPNELFQIKMTITSDSENSCLTLSCKIFKNKKRVAIATIKCKES